jgi:hypothetical protein
MGDQPFARTLHNTDIHTLSGIWTYDLSVRAGEECSCLRPCAHSHLLSLTTITYFYVVQNSVGYESYRIRIYLTIHCCRFQIQRLMNRLQTAELNEHPSWQLEPGRKSHWAIWKGKSQSNRILLYTLFIVQLCSDGLRAGWQGFDSQQCDFHFYFTASRPALRPFQPPT